MLDPIRSAIFAKLQAVPDIGTVQPFQRYADDYQDIAAHYMQDGFLLGWHVTRGQVVESLDGPATRRETVTWHITGYRGWSDADQSQILMDDLVDAIRDAFRTLRILGDALPRGAETAGIQVDSSESVMFAGILSHRVELSLQTTRLIEFKTL